MAFTAVPVWAEHPPEGFSRLAIEVGIIGDDSAEAVDVVLICDDPTVRGKGDVEGKDVNFRGRSFTFRSDEVGPLAGRRWYYLPEDYVEAVKAVFDVVSSDGIHVQVLVDGEKKTIDGETISDFVSAL
ncbi:MAG TPA: hypothetical protein VJ739_17030 [Gemmataceae bacterium]|nr:hypothetical protein [Gemmataceae bacterium]